MNFFRRFQQSRWNWLVRGLPSLPRASALFRCRRYTMTSPTRCKHLWNICKEVLDEGIQGSFVECGVWRGGSAGIMGLVLKHSGASRTLHLFDSFEGLPEPTAKDGAYAAEYSGGRASGALVSVDQGRSSLSQVQDFLLNQLWLEPSLVRFHAGWFQETIPAAAPQFGPIALLRLDGDWYESTRICLDFLYPLLSPGGVLILDDFYAWEGCARAVEEFRLRNGITSEIRRIDRDAAFWRVDRTNVPHGGREKRLVSTTNDSAHQDQAGCDRR
jgi:O-methyltransferase